MKLINCKMSIGEFLDRLAILYVKKNNIRDAEKLRYIEDDISLSEQLLDDDMKIYLPELISTNTKMWQCNEARKAKLAKNEIDDDYVQLTIEESVTNDQRFRLKNEINRKLNSLIREQKSYL